MKLYFILILLLFSTNVAKKYFGNDSPVGAHLSYDTMLLTVTGVFKEIPSNSHLYFEFLITNPKVMNQGSGAFTYCLLPPETDINALSKQLLKLPISPDPHFKIEEIKFQPLLDLHFGSNMIYEIKPPGNYSYLFLFAGIGLLILIISCTNYINLSIAIYSARAKEIAIRKVNGAQYLNLVIQFLGESILFALLCLPVTLTLLQIILPWFNSFMSIRLENSFVFSLKNFLSLISIVVIVGTLSGVYPAFVLPRIKAVSLFKKNSLANREGFSLRRVLVSFQFTLLVLLASSSWMVHKQLELINEKDLGFVKEG